MKKITINDIAKMAGVSKSTVSRVLNNQSDVSLETRNKVLSIISKNNFSQNKHAFNLTSNSGANVLILATRLYSYTEVSFISGFIKNLDSGIDYSIVESNFDFDFVRNFLKRNSGKYDYIIYFATGHKDYLYLDDILTPIIYIGQESPNNFSVVVDNNCVIKTLMKHAIKNHHVNNMLYIALPDTDYTSGYERTKQVKAIVKENNINLKVIYSNFNPKEAYQKIKEIDLSPYDLIGCATDKLALAANGHRLKSHLEDIHIFGIGNYEELIFSLENFSTMELDFYNSGQELQKLISSKVDFKKLNKRLPVGTKLITY